MDVKQFNFVLRKFKQNCFDWKYNNFSRIFEFGEVSS